MKKLLSLLLALAMLIAAMPALAAPLDLPFLDSVQDWAGRINPAKRDYSADFSLLDMSFLQGLLREEDGTTELKISSPLFSLLDSSLFGFGSPDLAVLQYSKEGLAIRAGSETWLVDVNAILNFLTRKQDYTKAAVKADLALIRNLAAHFVMEVLEPTVSINPLTSALTLHFDVDGTQMMDRIPLFLENLKDQEAEITALMIKYGAELFLAETEFTPSLAGIRDAWADYAAICSVSSYHLQADAVISLAKQDQPMQAGITGVLTAGRDSCVFSVEHLPTKENGTLTMVTMNGFGGGQYFDYSLEINRSAGVLDIDITATETDTVLYKFYAVKEEQNVEVTAYSYVVSTNMLNELSYGWYYDQNTGELSATMDYITGPLENQTTVNLYTLNASIQEKGITGTLFVGDEGTWHFTWTTAPLYYRLMVSAYADDVIRDDFDLWLFPQGTNDYRYRASIRTIARDTLLLHYLVTGAFNPDAFSLNISEAGGDTLLDLNLNYEAEGEDAAAIGSCSVLAAAGRFNASGTLRLSSNQPSSFEGDLVLTSRNGENRLNAWHLSWVPGLVTYVDGINYYTLTRTENTEKELSYQLTRNECVDLGSVVLALDENDRISLNASWEGTSLRASAGPVPEESGQEADADTEQEEAPAVIGIVEGTLNADGTLVGVLTQPAVAETEPAAEPAPAIQRIQPLDLTNAIRIDVKYFIQNFLLVQP